MDVFEQFFCPASDFLGARMIDCGFGVCRGENPPASCVGLGAGECDQL